MRKPQNKEEKKKSSPGAISVKSLSRDEEISLRKLSKVKRENRVKEGDEDNETGKKTGNGRYRLKKRDR